MTLLQLFFPAVLLVLAQSEQPDPIQWKCLYQTAVGFTIKSKHQASTSNTCSVQSCIKTHCEDVKYCALTFNKESGQCIGVSDMAVDQVSKLASSGDLMEESKGWMVIVSEEVKVTVKADTNNWNSVIQMFSPAAFWPLDCKNKGRNLGIEGEDLNMDVTGVDWNSKGPNGSKRKFARFSKKSRAKVQLKKNGELALNLTTFTIGAWIKRDEGETGEFYLIYGNIYVEFSRNLPPYIVTVWLNCGYINSNSISKYNFTSNTDYSWHHFAFVFDGRKAPTIYMDGKPMAIHEDYVVNDGEKYRLPSKLSIGGAISGSSSDSPLIGGMACLFISEAALKPEEIKQLKISCP